MVQNKSFILKNSKKINFLFELIFLFLLSFKKNIIKKFNVFFIIGIN